ncbi:RDD family protein [Thalassotalea sp. LPB0316]|uniref:RDD family protein n=1 Tax=Thalassotalea sp. LPB0316 TaxID=2769490 RepID=UPI00186753EE|nr:RDD family protein [Thalassotalea sp. LPB0316]QOL24731.1 RDD family protein [Thalassotalea sp. LPB0316]
MSEPKNEQEHPLYQEQAASETILSKNDTMKVLTPFAFQIDQSLFGLSLATPSRRLLALIVDLFIIALLSDAPGELLAIFLSITFYRVSKTQFFDKNAQQNRKYGKKRRAIARWLAAIFLFIALFSLLPMIIDPLNKSSNNEVVNTQPLLVGDKELSADEAIAFTATTGLVISTINTSECSSIECWQQELVTKLDLLEGIAFKRDVIEQMYGELATHTPLPVEEQRQLAKYLISYHEQSLAPQHSTEQNTPPLITKPQQSVATLQADEQPKKDRPVYSIIQYIEALIQDLGLGFGWAAFYFTVLTSAWHGQTLGKKLLGIRVIQLDGTPLSLWDSFGRYGGYGAGIATGLLGFLQVFWDPNRQAIHDKISATVVIDHKREQLDKYVEQQSKEQTNNDNSKIN